jgi:hypothetical protein
MFLHGMREPAARAEGAALRHAFPMAGTQARDHENDGHPIGFERVPRQNPVI